MDEKARIIGVRMICGRLGGGTERLGSDHKELGMPNLDFNLKAVGSHQRFLQ